MPVAAAIPYVVAAASTYSAIDQANSARKAASAAGNASQVNINSLNDMTRQISKQNALDSAELERQLTPEVPALRTAANQGVLNGLRPDAGIQQSTNLLQSSLGSSLNTPLLQAAIARAKQNLALGGNLDVDTQNAVTRHALASAGTLSGPGGGLGLGRDVTARDLGLTSLQLQQQRLNDAASLGGQEAGVAQFDANNILQKINMLKALSDSGFTRQLAAAQYGQGIQQPLVGLDPSSIANIVIGNSNNQGRALTSQANISGAQSGNWMQLLGSSLGSIYGQARPGVPSTPKVADNGLSYV